MTETIAGIVIKKIPLNADNEVVTILTRNELFSFIALGVRKITSKNRVALDYGNIITVEVFRAKLTNKLSKLKRATLLQQPPITISDTATVLLEIIRNIKKINHHSQKLFDAFISSYKYFGVDYNHHIKTFILFNALDGLGIYPKTNACVECGRNDRIIGFDYKIGGFLCAWHVKKERDLEELKSLYLLSKSFEEYKNVDPYINKKLYEEIIYVIRQYMNTSI